MDTFTAGELIDTALVLESHAEECGPDCRRIYSRRAAKFREAANRLIEATPGVKRGIFYKSVIGGS